MSIEQVSQVEQPLDLRWFNRFASEAVEAYALLDGDAEVRAAEKQSFLESFDSYTKQVAQALQHASGTTEELASLQQSILAREVKNPSLGFPKLEAFDCASREAALLQLKSEILLEEKNNVVREIYRTKINETIAELRMLAATKLGDDRRFTRYSSFVYGYPDGENTSAMASVVQEKVSRGKTEEKKAAALKLRPVLETLVPVIPERGEALVTSLEATERVSTVEEAVTAFETALAAVGAVDGWSVVANTDTGISNFRVSQKEKAVYVPAHKVVGMLAQDMQAFIQHEVYGHVARRIAGENSILKLLATGLDRTEKGEEGVATRLEQLENGADTYSHPERYFAIALARGDVDGLKRDFRQTFEVLKDYYITVLVGKKTGPTLDERAADRAWGLAVRVFRGTTGDTPGAVFTKDLNYFVGNKETWALVNTDEQVVQYFTIGKFDAANARHVAWLTKLGITDARLAEIQSETFTSQKISS